MTTERSRDDRPQYHHDPDRGETHAPDRDAEPEAGRDPHDALNAPADERPPAAPGRQPQTDGMGARPAARGERISSRRMPPEDE